MGASFNYVVVPKHIQSHEELQNFYKTTKEKLYEEYGEGFEGYTGDLASDNDELEIKNLCMKISKHNNLEQDSFDEDDESIEKMIELVSDHVEKWGPSIAIRVNEQWVICGSYSD